MGAHGPGKISPMMSEEPDNRVPARVDVAFDMLRWANAIETGQGGKSYEQDQTDGRKLNSTERAVYESALEVIRLYLTGEMTFSEDREPDNECVDSLEPDLENDEDLKYNDIDAKEDHNG
jgi:hypothetical protein